jgi:hypothetical protein
MDGDMEDRGELVLCAGDLLPSSEFMSTDSIEVVPRLSAIEGRVRL